ncbi:MAG: thioredoxin [Chloroflexi bacterium]|nr:thioredoxin [Chloroflexota bacterium]MCC6891930.1 thioredoxin [Anaerolineae bacterium]
MHNTIDITNGNFQASVLESDLPVLVDFGADWCPPCKMLEPIVDEIAAAYQGQMRVVSINVDYHPDIQQQYGIMGLPTLILFQGGEPVKVMVGYQPRQKLEAQIKPYLNPVTGG